MSNTKLRVITHLEAISGTEEQSKSLLLELVASARQEPDCIKYELLQNIHKPTEFTLVSEWKSLPSFLAHLDSVPVVELFRESSDLLAKAPDIRQYQLVN